MPVLEIRHRTGKLETRELTRQAPILVGRLATNDIAVDADDVAPVHCRISWNRRNFEVAAVTAAGVQHNGATVRQASLSVGDIVRVGDVDLVIAEERAPQARVASASPPASPFAEAAPDVADSIHLKAITQDLPVPLPQMGVGPQRVEAAAKPPQFPAQPDPSPPVDRRAARPDLRDVFESAIDLDALAKDEVESSGVPEEPHQPYRGMVGLPGAPAATRAGRPKASTPSAARPGEQEVLRSPLVMTLGIAVLLLLLAAATIWFLLAREKAQREFNAAQSALDSGLFSQAIEEFQRFVEAHPRHRLADQARLSIAQAKVEQPLAGAVPAWDAGLQALNQFVSDNRNSDAFKDPESEVRKFVARSADRIAFGAAETARLSRQRPPLAISAEGISLLELYSPSDARPEERLREIAGVTRAAEAAIVEQEAIDAVTARLDEGLKSGLPLPVLPDYRRLLDRHPRAAEYKPLQERIRQSLALLARAVTRDDSERQPLAEDRPASGAAPLVLARRIRARSDISSVGETVFATAEGSVFGIDTATGDPLWRRVVGGEAPFAPVTVAASVPSVLLFDSANSELLLLHRRTGRTVWRFALASPPRGIPLVHEGQLFIATSNGTLEQVDLQTGRGTARLTFPQPLAGPPVVSPTGQRLYVLGDSDVAYILTRRPLACERTVWLGHGPGSIVAPPLMLRDYLLVAENDRTDKSRLRLLDAVREDQPLTQIAQFPIQGLVRDAPAVRGKQLAVPSTPERVSAFIVAETGDEQALTPVASYQVKDAQGGPIFTVVGADDQLWMVSTALRRFTISRSGLLPDKQQAAIGLASQPLEVFADSLYVGRHARYSRAVLFSEVERHKLATLWQTSLGATIIAAGQPAPDGSIVCVNSLGELFQVSAAKLASGGFESQALGQIAVPEGLSESLSACGLSDGRLAIWCGGAQPRLWLTGGDGQAREHVLSHPLQADPVSLGPGVLLPLAGRLRLLRESGIGAIEDLPAPLAGTESPAWRAVAALDETQGLVLNANGRLTRVQFRTAPVAHLAEIASWEAAQPVDVGMAVDQKRVAVADATGRVVLLNSASFEPLGAVNLGQPARRSPWFFGDLALVETVEGRLVALDVAEQLSKRWDLSLEGSALADKPAVVAGKVLVATLDGRVLEVDPLSGDLLRTHDCRQRLAFGPQLWGQPVVGTVDGALLWLNQFTVAAP